MASLLFKYLKNQLSCHLSLFSWEVHFINLHCRAKFKTQDEPQKGESLNHDDIRKNESWSLALVLIQANNFPLVRLNSRLEFKSKSPSSEDKEARSKFSVLTNLLSMSLLGSVTRRGQLGMHFSVLYGYCVAKQKYFHPGGRFFETLEIRNLEVSGSHWKLQDSHPYPKLVKAVRTGEEILWPAKLPVSHAEKRTPIMHLSWVITHAVWTLGGYK